MKLPCCALAVLMLLWHAPALGQSASLSWSAPRECAQQAAVQERVQALAGRAPNATGTLVRRAGGYTLHLEIETGSGTVTRDLQSRDCAALTDSATTLIALTMEADREPEAVTSSSEARTNSEAEATPEPGRVAAVPELPRKTTPRHWMPWLALGGGLSGYGLPSVRPDVSGALGMDVSYFSFALRYAHSFATTRSIGSGASARFAADALSVQGCARLERGRLSGGPCASLQGMRIDVAPRGLMEASRTHALWAQLGLGAALRVRLFGPVALGIDGGLLLPLSARPRFLIEPSRKLEEGRMLGGYLHLEGLVRFE